MLKLTEPKSLQTKSWVYFLRRGEVCESVVSDFNAAVDSGKRVGRKHERVHAASSDVQRDVLGADRRGRGLRHRESRIPFPPQNCDFRFQFHSGNQRIALGDVLSDAVHEAYRAAAPQPGMQRQLQDVRRLQVKTEESRGSARDFLFPRGKILLLQIGLQIDCVVHTIYSIEKGRPAQGKNFRK